MKNLKKFLALGLAGGVLAASLTACGGDSGASGSGNANEGGNVPSTPQVENNDIIIGHWWDELAWGYQTTMAIEDAAAWEQNQDKEGDDEATLASHAYGRKVCELKYATMEKVRDQYGVTIEHVNLTYPGVKDSINTSILAGTPDCDIYLVEPALGVPAQANGLAIDLKTILPADDDLFTTQTNVGYLDLGDGKACIIYRQSAEKNVEATYPLAFNMQLLEDAGLEDPRDLWERGEWTWDVFLDYCTKLTQDTDGDGQNDQFGYCGYMNETIGELLMSNGTTIAGGPTETLSSAATGEVLQMVYDMYNTYNVCYPYDFEQNGGSPSDSMRGQYTSGKIGFFPIAAWIESSNGDYDWDGSLGTTLPFDIAYVRWPVGPNGNKDTNPGKNNTQGEFYFIPAGTPQPEKVYNILYDLWNWYDGDLSVRDDREALIWWYKVTGRTEEMQEANFNVMADCGAHAGFDLVWSISVDWGWDMENLIMGTMTPAQFQETYKQAVQDELNSFFK